MVGNSIGAIFIEKMYNRKKWKMKINDVLYSHGITLKLRGSTSQRILYKDIDF